MRTLRSFDTPSIVFDMTEFETEASPQQSLRHSYLKTLDEPQEWFLEELVQSGRWWSIPSVAYGVTSGQTLVEFYVDQSHSDRASRIFDVLRQQAKFNVVLAKSFDHQLLQLAAEFGAKLTDTGYLFRKYHAATRKDSMGLVLRPSTLADLAAIWQMNDDFFDTFDEVTKLSDTDNLWALEREETVIGCGVTSRVIADMDAIDLGMLISPEWRRLGYGSFLISELAEQMVGSGLRPICGCAEHNLASRMTLQRAGFVADHRLVHCEFR